MNLEFPGAIALVKTSIAAPRQLILPLLSETRFFLLRDVFPPLEEFL